MLRLKKINKSYTTGDFTQNALKEVSLEFRKKEFVAVLGPSGSGKTTLLNIIGGLDRYDSGDLIINNKSTKTFKGTEWDAYRNNCIGFVFQNYNLISHINVLANVEMGMTLSGVTAKQRRKKALEVLKKVGLEKHAHKKPNQLSGGQMQRVAIARALANDPDIILADEPTGALDSKTSVQIMELIKEIAKDKLVIMVTHNPELAENYANRIISMKDGKVVLDTKPIEKSDKEDNVYSIKKTAMSFFTALKLSINNIKTKKGRTLLTAFASSIGIIGIALILSLSNGFDKQIESFERNTLSSMPIIISAQSMNLDEDTMMELEKEMNSTEGTFQDIDYVIPTEDITKTVLHQNNITNEFIDYLESADSKIVSGISYMRYTSLNLINMIDNKATVIDTSKINISSLPKSLDKSKNVVVTEKYDILAGDAPKNYNEIALVVDSKNHISENVIKALGLKKADKISFTDILSSDIRLALNKDYYVNNDSYFRINTDLDKVYKNAISLKVVGILRLNEEFASYMNTSGLVYTDDLLNYVIENNNHSDIVKKQRSSKYNVLTGETFDLNNPESKASYELALAYLGASSTPYYISVYPNDFESKDEVLTYLDNYNKDLKVEDKIVYTDQAKIMSTLSEDIMDAITIVLVAFSGISLVVSSIMIGIIMYISVLERTKEIGILRSLGARKKDISRVFNAETFIIGVSSGLLGILIARLLLIPINALLLELTNLENVAILNPIHAIILITVSVVLTLIGGWLPAKIASKKDPVIALRTE